MICLKRIWRSGLLVLVFQCVLIASQGPGPGPGKRSPKTLIAPMASARTSMTTLAEAQMQSRAVDTRVTLEIPEGQPRGTVVGSIPTKPGFTYRFNENPREFHLNASTGEITTTAVLDRESLRNDRYDLVVLSSQPTYPIEVRIVVIDMNDNSPEFPESSIEVSFSESANTGTRLILDTATDKDSGVNGVSTNYRIVDGNEDEKFKLLVTTNPSGETSYLHMETTGKLDRETKAFYQLNISAQDGGTPPRFGYLQVNVTILDVNDNPPIFDHSDYIVSLNESVPPGTSVLQVMATDSDIGDNAKITYYLADTETQFTVDPETGVISTADTLNCQQNCPHLNGGTSGCPKSCVFTVFARDHGTPRQDGRTYVTVNLVDANDHDPIVRFRYFPPTAGFATVDENAQNGSVVAAVSVIDFDEGLNGETTVEIRAGNELNHFRLEYSKSFDIVRVNGVLDREEINKYNLTIVATDKGTPPRSSTTFLIIYVNDVNDHEPVFEKSEYSAILSELVPVGTYVAGITATDEDTGVNSNIYYAFVSGNEHQWFDIDVDSGLITTKGMLDREVQGTVQLKISARDGGPNPKWAYTQLKVTILDENDEKPEFAQSSINVSLSESTPPNTLVAMLTALDHDQGTNGSVTYSLQADVDQNYPNMFALDSMTGQLTTKTKLDRETISEYEIKVIAKDQGIPPQSSTATVYLFVEDVNDNSPEFYPQQYFVPVDEEVPVGAPLLQVTASDEDEGDNAMITYSIASGGDGLFHVDEKSGEVSLKAPITNFQKSLYRLKITAKDKGDRKAVEDAVVEIIKSHDMEHLNFDTYGGYHFQIRENHEKKEPSIGREVGRVRVNDKVSRNVRYSIVFGDPKRTFHINANTGIITTANRIDREQVAGYYLTVVARSGLAYGSVPVNITILDENDNQPMFGREKEEAKLNENAPVGHEVYVARAVDRDAGVNSRITYSLTDSAGEQFRIAENTGVIYLNKPIRAEPGTVLHLEVMATDSGVRSLSSRHSVSVFIEDVNDHTPVFDHTSYETSLLESTPVNDRFFALFATDVDLGPNGRISYEITEGNSVGKFGVFPDGYLYVKSSLDREERDYYSLVVTARDHGNPPRSSAVPVVIHVIDENDNKPEFTNSTFKFHIRENEPPDTFVGKLTATDLDIGRNAELTFSIVTTQNDFVIDPKNGFIKSLHYFDRESLVQTSGQNFITLEAAVADNGVNRLKDKVKVNIYITDVNDNAPKFLRTPYKVQVSEATSTSSQVLRVFTVDIDDGLNGDVFYTIVGGNEDRSFEIDEATGQITLARALDRETTSSYELAVAAYDAGESVTLSATTKVYIDVLDENDNAPEFTQTESQITILETTPVNTELIQFRATDNDLGINKEVTFSIAAGNRRDTFHVDATTGTLYLHKPVDYEELSVYYLNITASDGGNPRLSTTVPFTVKIEDYNDNPPVFPNTAIVRQIQEGIPVKTPIVTVTAEDPDSGVNGKVSYAIVKQEPEGRHFGINPSNGVIHTLRPIDREFADTFRLTVVATDQAVPETTRLSAEKLVTVIVEDINDNAPFFTSMNTAILPKPASKESVVMYVHARDLDSSTNGLVTYELVSGNTDLFSLHRSTGALTLKRNIPDPEIRYQLTVKATDEAVQTQRKSTEAYVTLIASSSSDAGGPVFGSSEPYAGRVYENEPVGTSVLTVNARLPSNTLAGIEYYLTNVTARGKQVDRLFDIDTKLGVLSTAAVLDREGGSDIYEVEVYAIIASSPTPHTQSTKIRVNVLDKNDSPPSFADTTLTYTVSEDLPTGQVVAKVKATDPDTLGQLTYVLVDGGEGKFEMGSATGVLRLKDTLDREAKDTYHLKIRASDGQQHQDTVVTIKVTDTNDNPPIFKESAYSFDIPENTPRGSRVGKVTAHDDDEDNNGQVTYTVISDWANDVFSLNPQTGVFTLTSRLDYEEVQHYIFVVQAQDTGKPSLSSTLTVYFNVVDLNDNTPLFDPMSYSKEIYENMTVGTSVVAVSATDLDSGDNGRIAYSISSGNEDEDFHIAQNGTIYTVRSLNRENKSFYNLIVTARDQANPTENRLSSTVQVTIVLKDVNDMAPEFITPNETAVLENIPMGTVVMAVKAVDKDEGRNSYIEYSLDTTPEDMFVLGPVDGLLRVSGRLDRETRTNYTLKVTARDRGDPPRSSTTRILVRVLDENDNSPVFDPKQYSASVAENASIGVSVLQVSATDVDEALNGRVRYVIVAGDKNRDFAISEDTGIIRVAKNLNYERKNHYLLTIQAEDTGDDVRYDSAALSISVTDINDNPPTFLDSPYIAYVMENMDDLPASVVTVSAYDADTTPYNQVRYFIKEGDNNLFKINASSGEITLHRSLDREERAEYVLTLVAMDTGTPPLTGTGTVKIVVQDMNDHSPEFERQIYTASVLENQPADTPVVQPVALDKDSGLNARIMYSLVGTLSERFKVDELSGLVTTAVPLDREERDVYHLSLVARDSSVTEPRSTTANVTILVMDQNDNAPSFSEEKYNVHIPDKTQPGQFVFGAKAVDEDINQNSKIVYYLSGRDADKFYMNQETGVIKSSQELVGENSVFLLQIQATDGGKEPRSAMADLEVRLKPANLFPNISLQKQTFSFSEDMENQVITRVKASSPKRGDAGVIQYLIAGGNVGNAFRIDNRTGEVIVGEGLDYETSPVYEVWIEARDSDDPPLRSVVQLNINVTDSNDNAPVLDYFLYNATILEEELPPQKVIQIHATDADSGKNSQVLYQLKQNGDTDNAFTLDAKTGDIYTNIKLDREAIGSYSLTVEAVDQGTPQRTGTATVLITVLDKNDNPPRFTRLFSVNVTENAEIGTFVIQVTSSDLDIGENANASYSFTDNPSEKFHIDPLTGNVTVTGMLDRESQDEYLLKVAAVDGSWRAETPLTITIQDQNDNSPEFEHSYYSFNFPELQRNVAFVGQVTATDRDKQGPNSVISYSLKHPSDFFTVDPASGEIFSKQSMRYKHTTLEPSPENQYVLTVIATDNGKPPMSSECMVTINVVDANNNAPKFEEENYFTPVPESASVGQKVLQLRAKDEGDFGVNAELEYVKIGGNGSELFNVGKTSGWITVAYSLHGKRMKQYSLIVRAVDKGVPPQQDEAIITLVITGENRYTPVFTALSYQVIVPENEPLGSTIVTVTATDNDDGPNGMVRYSISSGNEREEFAVNSKTGAVTIRHPLDYDIIQEYHLNITAKDLGFQMRHTTAMLTVTLTDINDNAPTFNQSSYKAYLTENSPPKTFVYKVRAVDIDSAKNAIVQYSLVGGSGKELFTINTNTGEIFSKISFDYEEKSLYSLDILAANPGSTMYGSTKVEVYISGENEFYPKFIQPVFHFSVSESASVGTSVGTIQATDQDAGDDGNVYYLFVGSSNDRGFTIGSETGVISVARKLDRETQNRVVLTVMAKNYGGIRGNDTDEAQVIISIQDGNDPPEFLEPVYEAKISEGVPVGSKVTTVTAVDKDVRPKNNQFAYSIIGGNIGKVFKVDPQTGDIETTSKLDRETVAMYTLKVGAIDTGSPPQTGTAEVHILVQDINDNGPVFDPPNVVGYVTENEPPMTSVMLLSATDPDLPPNGAPFTYHLFGGKHKDMVQVDRLTGLVKTTRSIDREVTPELHVEVEVQDSGKPRMKSQYPITIVVLDKNDSPSSARGVHVLVHTFNDALPVGKIADIHPNDPDTSGQYQCKIVNGQQHGFSISAGCDLHTLKVHPGSEYILSVSGNDGQHSDVMSTVTVSFISFDNATVENSLTLRVENMTATKFLSHFYKSFVDLLKSTFDAIDSPYLFSIHGKDGGLELTIAIKGAKGYRSKAKVAETLSQKRNAIQQLLQTSSVSIGYSPCKKSTCENGGSCSEGIHVYEDTEISDSQALIFTSPLVSHDFSCRCQEGFTGKRCDKRQDPCSPNPCQFGGTCRRQGFDFQCSCPPLYDGKLCEIERSNVCDDNPCKNGGSCRETPDGSFFCLCRPGYRGNQCEAAADSCRPNPCLNGGLCVSLKPGYKCNCPDMYYGTHCEKSTFGFNELSYMVFPPLDANTNDISLIFSTSKPNSLLVYNFGVQTGGRSDFVAIELLDGKPTLSYGGARTAITSISVSTYVANGEWYKITATRNGRVVSLGVTACTDHGDICKDCKPGDKNCYADDIGPSGTLNFNNQPMYLGGLMTADPILERPGQVNTDDFVGCIHSVAINGRPLNLSSPAQSQGIDTTCPRMKSICTVDLQDQCGLGGHCLDRWRTSSCLCSGGIYAPNCDEAFEPVSLGDGGFLEFRVSKKHRRMQLLEGLYDGTTLWKRPSSKIRRQRSWLRDASAATSVQSPQKKVSIMFRTMQKRGLLFYAATNNDFTSVEILDGQVKYVSRLGAGNPVNMTVPGSQVSDGSWHNLTIYSHNRGLRMLLDGSRVGDELDSAGVHDFLDPYLTTISLGGARRELYLATDGVPAFEGCLANFSINGEIQPFNGSGSILEEVVQVGKVSQGCLRSIVGAAAAPDPLSIGITLVIVFFVILLVAILISFVVFRLRRQKKEKGQGHPKQNGSALLAGSGGGGGGGDGTRSHPDPSGFLENGEVTSDVLRGHLSQEMVAKKYKEREVTERPQRPDIIEREVVNKSPGIQMRVVDDGHETSGVGGIADSDIPEHYDLENASSIAPSDIDIVYHYKGYRDGNVRKYKTNPHLPPNYHHKHGHRHSPHNFPPPQSAPPPTHHRESPRNLLRQSPNPVPPPRDSPNVLKMQTTPLARLSPSSELSQQTPRILTLQDISGKPLQSALLATSQGTGVKDVLTNSERSLNSPVSHLSQSSGSVHASSQGGGTKKRKPGTVDTGGASAGVTAGGAVNSAAAASAGVVAIGLTAEEIERLNSRPRNSSLVSTLDAVSSSSDDPRHERGRRRKDQLAELLETNTEILDPHDSSTTDESGNDSFTCSEFEYDNGGYEKRDFTPGDVIFSKLAEAEDENDQESESAKPYDGFDSFRGSLSTLVASDDDLSNMSPYRPPNGSALGWDYLLNWGPNFESLVGVFKDIAELPDTTSSRVAASLRLPNSAPKPSEEYV